MASSSTGPTPPAITSQIDNRPERDGSSNAFFGSELSDGGSSRGSIGPAEEWNSTEAAARGWTGHSAAQAAPSIGDQAGAVHSREAAMAHPIVRTRAQDVASKPLRPALDQPGETKAMAGSAPPPVPPKTVSKPEKIRVLNYSPTDDQHAELQRLADANARTTDFTDFADNVAHWVADRGEPAVAETLYTADLVDAHIGESNPAQAKAFRQAIEGAVQDIYPDALFRLARPAANGFPGGQDDTIPREITFAQPDQEGSGGSTETPDSASEDEAWILEGIERRAQDHFEDALDRMSNASDADTPPTDVFDQAAVLYLRSGGGLTPEAADGLLDAFEASRSEIGDEAAWRRALDGADAVTPGATHSSGDNSLWLAGRGGQPPRHPRRAPPGQSTQQWANMMNIRSTVDAIKRLDPHFTHNTVRPGSGPRYTSRELKSLERTRDTLLEYVTIRENLKSLGARVPSPEPNALFARRDLNALLLRLRNQPSFEGANQTFRNPYYEGFLARPPARSRELNRIFEQLWRTNDRYPGGTAAMLRREVELGRRDKTHYQKAGDYYAHLRDFLANPNTRLSRSDRRIAYRVLGDLRLAIQWYEAR